MAGWNWVQSEPERIAREVMCRSVAGREARVVVFPDTLGPGAVLLCVPGTAILRLTVRQSRSISKALRWAEQQPAECVDPTSQSEEP
jgi:hypothetical protein